MHQCRWQWGSLDPDAPCHMRRGFQSQRDPQLPGLLRLPHRLLCRRAKCRLQPRQAAQLAGFLRLPNGVLRRVPTVTTPLLTARINDGLRTPSALPGAVVRRQASATSTPTRALRASHGAAYGMSSTYPHRPCPASPSSSAPPPAASPASLSMSLSRSATSTPSPPRSSPPTPSRSSAG